MKDNRKKLIVVAALALVIVSVGVFQFMGGSSAPPAAAPKNDKKVVDLVKPDPVKNPLFAKDLSPRDPFQQPSVPAPTPAVMPTPPPTHPPVERPAPQQRLPRGDFETGGSFGGPGTAPVLMAEPKFGFTVSGVMLGAKPMAVFNDASGSQRLVMLGGSLDPDSKVISIEKDAVTVRYHGKTLRLNVEGNPNAK